MNKKTAADIDPRSIAVDFFRKLGGMEGMTKWGKTHRSLAYGLIAKLLAQPTVQTNVHVAVINEEATRAKLQDALLRQIEARKYDDVDPVVTVNGERIVEHQSLAAAPAPGSDFENLKSPIQGPLFDRGGVSTTPGEGKKNQSVYSKPIPSIPGLAAGVALDGLDENKSSTQLFYEWKGHGRPP
jgi:hypothetical protein